MVTVTTSSIGATYAGVSVGLNGLTPNATWAEVGASYTGGADESFKGGVSWLGLAMGILGLVVLL